MVVPAMKVRNFHFSEVTKFWPRFSRARGTRGIATASGRR
jgi:hypothetical protein